MNKLLRTILLLCIIAAASGCSVSAPEQQIQPRTEQIQPVKVDIEALYNEASEAVSLAKNLTLTVHSTKTMTIGENIFSETSEQTLAYTGYGTETMQAQVTEVLTMGDYSIPNTAAYRDGIGYYTVGNGSFQGGISAEDFCAGYAPAVILDASLYDAILATENNGILTVTFSQPTATEVWCGYSGAELVDATGTAVLGSGGQLLESTYTMTCLEGTKQIHLSTRVAIETGTASIGSADYSNFTVLDAPGAPLMLERACGYLQQAASVTASSTESIGFQAYGDTRRETVLLDMSGAGSGFTADLALSVELVNQSRGGEISKKDYTMTYANGVYGTAVDGEIKADNIVIAPEKVRIRCQDFLLATVILPEYVASAEMADQGDTYLFSFTASEALAELICKTACQTLYQDAEMADSLELGYETDTLTAYLSIDKDTGLPSGSGVSYVGIMQVDDFPYALSYQAEQVYDLLSPASSS